MAEAVQGPKPEKPRSITDWAKLLFDRAKERNVRLKTFVHLASYLEKCLEKRQLPQVNDVLRSLLPREAAKGLIPRSVRTVPFPAGPPPPGTRRRRTSKSPLPIRERIRAYPLESGG